MQLNDASRLMRVDSEASTTPSCESDQWQWSAEVVIWSINHVRSVSYITTSSTSAPTAS